MSPFDEPEEESAWARYRLLAIFALVALTAGGFLWWKLSHSTHAAPRVEHLAIVSLPPPPPKPVPTPPPVQPPPEQKVVDTKPRMDDAPKPDAPKPEPIKPPDEPPPSMGSNIKGDGADGFGLSGSGNGGFVGIGGKGHGGGGAFTSYAAQVQGRLAETLRRDPKTRAAAFDLKVKIWIDESGRVQRTEPSSGDAAVAALIGLRLTERPPAGMPMPISMRLVAHRPN